MKLSYPGMESLLKMMEELEEMVAPNSILVQGSIKKIQISLSKGNLSILHILDTLRASVGHQRERM